MRKKVLAEKSVKQGLNKYQFDEQMKTAASKLEAAFIYAFTKQTMLSTWAHRGNRSAAMAFFTA